MNISHMKIKSLFILSCLMAGTLSFTSCDDKLSALPTQSKVEGNLIVDQNSAEVALNGIYYMYAECGTDYYDVLSTLCAQTQEIVPARIAGTIYYYQDPDIQQHGPNNYGTDPLYQSSSTNHTLWLLFYSQLTTANTVITQMEVAPDSWFVNNRKAEILGEARFMRALIYYQILRYFGYHWDIDSPYGILLRTEPSKASNQSIARSSVKESYEAILKDLEYSLTNIKKENPNQYANVWVAKGLKVRILMMRGQQGDYTEAANIAQDIIEHGPYELEENVVDIFHSLGLGSEEVMFGIQPKSNQTDVYEAYYYRDAPQYFPSKNFYAIFDQNDPRKQQLFEEGEPYKDNYSKQMVYPITICKHFIPGAVAPSEIAENQYQMRLTEMYLLRAEALARTENVPEAKKLLKTVMEHAGITDFSELDAVDDEASFMEVYFKEYLKNLFCESGRELEFMIRMPKELVATFNPQYYDVVVDGENNVVSIGNHAFGYSVFAIPTDEFRYNKLLKKEDQNPGYAI